MKNKIAIYILVGALVILGVSMIGMGLTPPPELQDASALKRSDFSANAAYEFDELLIWDKYATVSDSGDNDNGTYYLASYEDGDGQFVLFSVYLDNSSEWKGTALTFDYETDWLGVNGCYRSRSVSALDNRLEDYYAEGVGYITDYLREYGYNPIDSGLHLRFVCNEAEEYADAASQSFAVIVGVVVLAAAAALFFFGRRSMKKQREAELAAQRELEAFSVVPRDTDYTGPEF